MATIFNSKDLVSVMVFLTIHVCPNHISISTLKTINVFFTGAAK